MFPLERGPLDLADPDAMRRLAPRPSLPGIVADALSDLPGLRGALDGTGGEVVDNPPDDLDGTYAATVGVAQDVVTENIQPAPPSPAPALIDQGNSADRIRTSVTQYLPQPDTPISATFIEPPAPPGGDTRQEPEDPDRGRA